MTIDQLPQQYRKKIAIQGDCWMWIAATQSSGYGSICAGRKGVSQLAHRATYKMLVGEIPGDLTVDHLCRNKKCVNPAHMEIVTRGENSRRASADITHCIRGHEFTPGNTIWKKNRLGRFRNCRECTNNLNRSRREQARAERKGVVA